MKNFIISEEKLNSSFALQSASDLKSITNVLASFNIYHFCYLKLFKDGSHLLLCTDPEWVKCFYLHHYSHAAHHKDPKAYVSGYELWDAVPDQSTANIAREQFNIAHGIALIDQKGEECELYHFATTRDNVAINNFYLNNLEILSHFTLFFKDRGQSLIQNANADRLILPHWLPPTEEEKVHRFTKLSIENHQKAFWDSANMKRYSLGHRSNDYLTAREMTCMSLLVRGFSTKQIASTLGVSTRTVEAHFDNLRDRLQCRSKYELVARVIRRFPHLI